MVEPVGLGAVADLLGVGPVPAVTLNGVSLRTSDIRPGDLFAALPGARAHGAQYCDQALAAGAVAVLTDPSGSQLIGAVDVPVLTVDQVRQRLGEVSALIYGHPARCLNIVGITGTSGKTTTSFLTDAALAAAGRRTALIGTVAVRMDQLALPSAFTTPEAPDLQALLALMVAHGVADVVMEVSSHALSQHRVTGTAYQVAAFTNLSRDHLDYHGDMDSYFAAKATLFDGRAEHAVICIDDSWGRQLAAQVPDAVTVSLTEPAHWQAHGVHTDATGRQRCQVHTPVGIIPLTLAMPGTFNLANAMLALACAHALGVDPAQAAPALAEVCVPGRMQRVDIGQDFLAVVDYAHKPAALAAVLRAAAAAISPSARVIVVCGAGGDRDSGKRPQMGAAAAAAADIVIVTDDNPRTEDPGSIRAAVLAGANQATICRARQIIEIGSRGQAIAHAVTLARPGDAVVIAGKGHEQGQYVGDTVLPFDDVAVLTQALRTARAGAL